MKLLLKVCLVAVFGFGLVAQAQDDSSIKLVLKNVGASAWQVTAVEGAEGIVELNADDPEISLTVGMRYIFDVSAVNSQVHPLEFRDAENNVLLAQGSKAGSLEEDAEIAFESTDEQLAFTLTPALAEALSSYRCTIHGSMAGSIVIVE
jgi:hypothetical protein